MKILFLFSSITFWPAHAGEPDDKMQDKKTDPLPHELVPELFEKIMRKEKISLPLIYQALIGPQFTLRANAAQYLAKHGDQSSLPHLIKALSDDSEHEGGNYPAAGMNTTRYWANEALKTLSGKDFGFVWNEDPKLRKVAISKWDIWLISKRKK